jgi:large subunit ribosomal protein L24e
MTKCVFCGKESSPYKGVHLIKNDGSVNFYCSSKCRRNSINLGRDKKKIKWTTFYTENRERMAKQAQRTADMAEAKKADAAKENK